MPSRSGSQFTAHAILLAAGILVTVLAPGPTSRPPTVSARCYHLAFDPWTAPLPDLYRPVPTSVRLKAEVLSSRHSDTLWRADRAPTDSLRRAAFWRRHGHDTIAIFFPSSWSTGITAHLPVSGDTIRGIVAIYVDFEPYEPPRASVAATSMDCADFRIHATSHLNSPQN